MMNKSFADFLKACRQNFHPVVSFDPGKEKLLLMDFTSANDALTAELLSDTRKFTDYINHQLSLAGAKFGIGGYKEHREMYRRSAVFDADAATEPRRLHLGIDIWGKPYTPVRTPLDGIIHSFAFNNNFGDYGATAIITHNLDGYRFHTLYGHLSLNSIKNLREGGNTSKGDVIGEFGIPMENGQWPPHLHFQVIIDMGEWQGDYPGVCAYSEREKYLKNSPDPDLLLGLMQYAHPSRSEGAGADRKPNH